MNKLNLPKFYVGQKVVCIMAGESINGENCVINGQTYTVTKTGHINESDEVYAYDYVNVNNINMNWDVVRFKPLKEMPAPLLTFEQIKKTEKEEILILN